MATYEDFARLDLRVGRILKAEPVEGSKKLYKLDVDIGERRTIVAGLAGYYTPEELEGRLVVVVANLEPRKIFGILSEGMLLAAVDGKNVALLTPDKEVKPGTKIE